MIYGEIFRQRLTLKNEHAVADTIDYLEMKFKFTDDWDGLEKWAHFSKGDLVYDILLTDDRIRKEDHLNLTAGEWSVYLHGNEFADGEVVERITTNVEVLRVFPTGSLDGEPFPEIPASETERILARLEKLEQNGGGGGTGGTSDAVLYIRQSLTDDQQAQARENIGAASADRVDELSEAIADKAEKSEIPKVFDWANAELPFTENEISDTYNPVAECFVVNPTNFADGKTYFRYHGGATNFTWTNPNQQKGAVTITVLSWRQWDTAAATSSSLNIVYSDGTTAVFTPQNGVASTYTTNANKTLAYIKGNYDIENWVLLDMSVMSIVADYPAPTGTVKSVNGIEPDESGNVEIDIPDSSGGTGISLGMTGAAVGQIARITAVDGNGMPTAWEPADMASGGEWKLLNEFSTSETVAEVEFTQSDDGVPYNLVATMVQIRCTDYEKEYGKVDYADNNVSMSINNVVHTLRRGVFKTWKQFGFVNAERWWAANSDLSDKSEYSTAIPLNIALSNYKNVTGIKLSTSNGQLTNWEIKIWGVEA